MRTIKKKKKRHSKPMANALTHKLLIKALNKSGGMVSHAADLLQLTTPVLYLFMKKHPEVKEELYLIRQRQLDICETELMKKIRSGDSGAIYFFLKCHGRDRGYEETTNFKVDASLLHLIKKMANIPDDDLERVASQIQNVEKKLLIGMKRVGE